MPETIHLTKEKEAAKHKLLAYLRRAVFTSAAKAARANDMTLNELNGLVGVLVAEGILEYYNDVNGNAALRFAEI